MALSLDEQINLHLKKNEDDCWRWSNSIVIPPIITLDGKSSPVRKILYSYFKKKSSNEYLISICKNRLCVNPYHMVNRDEMILLKINKEINHGCWMWTGTKRNGYGSIKIKRKTIMVHRLMYEKYKGNIPAGMNVCHSCDNPSCVNPDHLWLGTQHDNIKDMERKNRKVTRRGGDHVRAKISKNLALEIKLKYKNGIKPTVICRLMNLPYSTVYKICINENWKHITV